MPSTTLNLRIPIPEKGLAAAQANAPYVHFTKASAKVPTQP